MAWHFRRNGKFCQQHEIDQDAQLKQQERKAEGGD